MGSMGLLKNPMCWRCLALLAIIAACTRLNVTGQFTFRAFLTAVLLFWDCAISPVFGQTACLPHECAIRYYITSVLIRTGRAGIHAEHRKHFLTEKVWYMAESVQEF